ncbi:hypothetical protein CN918_28990 [Priestia megaterium]|nr:hypothetical protein CN918_28990 [Priestia megaterium]
MRRTSLLSDQEKIKGAPRQEIEEMLTQIIQHLSAYNDSVFSHKDTTENQFSRLEPMQPYPLFIHEHFEPIKNKKVSS